MFRRFDPKIDELQELSVFSPCTRKELETVARLVDEVRFEAGQPLMREGQAGRECFVIADGEAVISIDGAQIASALPGDLVGEMALLESEPRCATVEAVTPVRALVMTRQSFTKVLDSIPGVARRILRELAHRLRDVQSTKQAA